LKFRAGELEFNATVAEATESISAQTGEPLRILTIQFRAQKTALHDQALATAPRLRHGGLFSLNDADQPDLEWRVSDSSSSYVGSEPWGINHHLWRLEQVERLACTRLVIGAVELEPYDYAEEVSAEGVIRLAARALISEAQLGALSTMGDVVQVQRVGISDTPREMGLAYLWAERPNGLGVVVTCVDAALEPRLTLDGTTLADDTLRNVMRILSNKGVLDDADQNLLRQLRHAARHVKDTDAWRL
jgi:hypothetical protein